MRNRQPWWGYQDSCVWFTVCRELSHSVANVWRSWQYSSLTQIQQKQGKIAVMLCSAWCQAFEKGPERNHGHNDAGWLLWLRKRITNCNNIWKCHNEKDLGPWERLCDNNPMVYCRGCHSTAVKDSSHWQTHGQEAVEDRKWFAIWRPEWSKMIITWPGNGRDITKNRKQIS